MSTGPNYTIGSGKVYLAFNGDPTYGERYVGNSPGFSYSPEVDTLPVFETENGVVQQTESHVIKITNSLTLELDDITDENMRLFLMSEGDVVQRSSETFTKTIRLVAGNTYDMGALAIRDIQATSEGSAFDLGKLEIDAPVGLVTAKPDADIYFGQAVTLTFIGDGVSYREITAAATPYTGSLRYVEDNTQGENRVLFVPSLTLYPSAELDMKKTGWRSLEVRAELTSLPVWLSRIPVDDYGIGGPETEDFGDLSTDDPVFTDDYGVHE